VAAGHRRGRRRRQRRPAHRHHHQARDDPMVLTVGAVRRQGRRQRPQRHRAGLVLARSDRGGLAKPDVVAPGRTLVALRSRGLATSRPPTPRAWSATATSPARAPRRPRRSSPGLSALVLPSTRVDARPGQARAHLDGRPVASSARTDQGAGRVRLAAALTADPRPGSWQRPNATGLGSLEASRGSRTSRSSARGGDVAHADRGSGTRGASRGPAGRGRAGRGRLGLDRVRLDGLGLDRLGLDGLGLDRRHLDRFYAWTGSAWTGSLPGRARPGRARRGPLCVDRLGVDGLAWTGRPGRARLDRARRDRHAASATQARRPAHAVLGAASRRQGLSSRVRSATASDCTTTRRRGIGMDDADADLRRAVVPWRAAARRRRPHGLRVGHLPGRSGRRRVHGLADGRRARRGLAPAARHRSGGVRRPAAARDPDRSRAWSR
jgi:hypothetical protein